VRYGTILAPGVTPPVACLGPVAPGKVAIMSRRHAVAALLAVALVAGCGSQTVTDPPGRADNRRRPRLPASLRSIRPCPSPPRRIRNRPDPPAPTDPPEPTDPPDPDPTEPDEVQPTDPDPERLESGDRGPAVEALQTSLNDLGYWVGAVDGVYGGNTRHAVVALQKSAGLQRDGIAGPATQAALADGSGSSHGRPTAWSWRSASHTRWCWWSRTAR
jgi:hypothetical protein